MFIIVVLVVAFYFIRQHCVLRTQYEECIFQSCETIAMLSREFVPPCEPDSRIARELSIRCNGIPGRLTLLQEDPEKFDPRFALFNHKGEIIFIGTIGLDAEEAELDNLGFYIRNWDIVSSQEFDRLIG